MATLYVTEYERMGVDGNGYPVPIPMGPSLADQTVAISGSSAQSAAFQPQTRFVRLHTDVTCSVKLGANPTATTSTKRLYANTGEYIAIPQGQSFKVAVISNT